MKQRILLVVSILFGILVAFIDTRPTWNDSGITAFALLGGSAVLAFVAAKRPWLIALAVGIWLPLWYIVTTHDWSMVILFGFPLVGAYVGWAFQFGFRKLHHAV